MKLNTFDATNIEAIRTGKPTILLCRHKANNFSKAAIELTEWESGTMIAFHQDEENTGDWYISISATGFILKDKDNGAMSFHNAAMSNTILDSLGLECDSATFTISKEPVEVEEVVYWLIITANPIIRFSKLKT